MKNIPSGQIQLGVRGCNKPLQWVQGRVLVGVQEAKTPEALKSLQSTLPEVVKNSILVGHFFFVLHPKVLVTEKIIKIQNKAPNIFKPM